MCGLLKQCSINNIRLIQQSCIVPVKFPQHLQVLKIRVHVTDVAGHFVCVNLTLNVVNYLVILVEPVRKRMFESFFKRWLFAKESIYLNWYHFTILFISRW